MGIARKVPKINWLSSFGLILVAGTLYRVSKINRKIMEVQIKNLGQYIGSQYLSYNKKNDIKKSLPSLRKYNQGQCAKIYLFNRRFKRIQYHNKFLNSFWVSRDKQ